MHYRRRLEKKCSEIIALQKKVREEVSEIIALQKKVREEGSEIRLQRWLEKK